MTSSSSDENDDNHHSPSMIPNHYFSKKGWEGDEMELEHQRQCYNNKKRRIDSERNDTQSSTTFSTTTTGIDFNQFRNTKVGEGYQAKGVIRQKDVGNNNNVTNYSIHDMTAANQRSNNAIDKDKGREKDNEYDSPILSSSSSSSPTTHQRHKKGHKSKHSSTKEKKRPSKEDTYHSKKQKKTKHKRKRHGHDDDNENGNDDYEREGKEKSSKSKSKKRKKHLKYNQEKNHDLSSYASSSSSEFSVSREDNNDILGVEKYLSCQGLRQFRREIEQMIQQQG